jgi:ligand-binding sensor domain-containing protein
MVARRLKVLLLFVLFIVLFSNNAFCALTWWEVGVPYRVKIFTMAMCNKELYAGTWGKGVYKLSSRDQMWHELNKGLTNNEIRAIAVKGDEVFAGTWGGGIFKIASTDDFWINVSKGLTNDNILSLTVSGDEVYAGTWGSGVFRLKGEGEEWEKFDTGLINKNVNALLNSNGDIYAGTDSGMFVLKKGAEEWVAINLEIVINCLALGDEGEIYAGTRKGVYVLSKGEDKWESKSRGLRDRYILDIDVSEKGSLFVGTNSGVYKFKKGARFFKSLNIGLTNTNIQSLYINYVKTGKILIETIFAGTSVGVYKSKVEDNPRQEKIEVWSQIKTGLTKTIVRALTINERDIYAGTNKGVFKLSGGRGNWQDINVGLGNIEIESLAANSGDIYAATWGEGLYVLKKDALEWVEVLSPKKYIWALASSSTTIYVGTWGGIYMFNVTDMSWVPINYNLKNVNIYAITTMGGDVYIGTDKAVFSLSKGSNEWRHYSEGFNPDDLNVYTLTTDGRDVYAGAAYGVHVLKEGEEKFKSINKGFSNPNVYALVSTGGQIYKGTWRGVFRYDKVEEKWEEVNNGISKNTSIMELLESGGDLYAGTYGEGVFAGSLPPVITTNNGNDFTTDKEDILIEGTCYPYIISVKVNGSTDNVIYSPGSTTWSYKTTLDSALNRYTVTNVNELGNESGFSEITVTYIGK